MGRRGWRNSTSNRWNARESPLRDLHSQVPGFPKGAGGRGGCPWCPSRHPGSQPRNGNVRENRVHRPLSQGQRSGGQGQRRGDGRALSLSIYEVKGFRIETYNPDGTPNLIGRRSTCTFNVQHHQRVLRWPPEDHPGRRRDSRCPERVQLEPCRPAPPALNRVHAVFRPQLRPHPDVPTQAPQ